MIEIFKFNRIEFSEHLQSMSNDTVVLMDTLSQPRNELMKNIALLTIGATIGAILIATILVGQHWLVSKKLHFAMYQSLSWAPMSFFDTTPVGKQIYKYMP